MIGHSAPGGSEPFGGSGDVAGLVLDQLRLFGVRHRQPERAGLVADAGGAEALGLTAFEHRVLLFQRRDLLVDLAGAGGEAEGGDVEGDDPDQEHPEHADPESPVGHSHDQARIRQLANGDGGAAGDDGKLRSRCRRPFRRRFASGGFATPRRRRRPRWSRRWSGPALGDGDSHQPASPIGCSSAIFRAARRWAERERGLRSASSGPGEIARRVKSSASGSWPQTQTGSSGGQTQPRALAARNCFTGRSSSEWKAIAAKRPPTFSCDQATGSASLSASSSPLTAIRIAWKLRLAGWPAPKRAEAGIPALIAATSSAVVESGRR